MPRRDLRDSPPRLLDLARRPRHPDALDRIGDRPDDAADPIPASRESGIRFVLDGASAARVERVRGHRRGTVRNPEHGHGRCRPVGPPCCVHRRRGSRRASPDAAPREGSRCERAVPCAPQAAPHRARKGAFDHRPRRAGRRRRRSRSPPPPLGRRGPDLIVSILDDRAPPRWLERRSRRTRCLAVEGGSVGRDRALDAASARPRAPRPRRHARPSRRPTRTGSGNSRGGSPPRLPHGRTGHRSGRAPSSLGPRPAKVGPGSGRVRRYSSAEASCGFRTIGRSALLSQFRASRKNEDA